MKLLKADKAKGGGDDILQNQEKINISFSMKKVPQMKNKTIKL